LPTWTVLHAIEDVKQTHVRLLLTESLTVKSQGRVSAVRQRSSHSRVAVKTFPEEKKPYSMTVLPGIYADATAA